MKSKKMKAYALKQRVIITAVIINTSIFILLSILHFYWAGGGKAWYDDVLPTTSNGLHKFNPGTKASLSIAVGLLFLALITAGCQGAFDSYIKRTYLRYGSLAIAIIFFTRAIGDFKFVGFFKTVQWTRFGINDTQIFSPLCLFISLLNLIIFILSRNGSGVIETPRFKT